MDERLHAQCHRAEKLPTKQKNGDVFVHVLRWICDIMSMMLWSIQCPKSVGDTSMDPESEHLDPG